MVCDPGTADARSVPEAIEAPACNQQFLRARVAWRLFVNDETIVPVPVNIGNAQMSRRIGARPRRDYAVRIDAGEIACGVGSPRSTNAVGGALDGAPLAVDEWRDAISRRAARRVNLAAFDAGRKAAGTVVAWGYVATTPVGAWVSRWPGAFPLCAAGAVPSRRPSRACSSRCLAPLFSRPSLVPSVSKPAA